MKNIKLLLKAGKVKKWGNPKNGSAGRPIKGLEYVYQGRKIARFNHRINDLKQKEGWTYYFRVIYGDESLNEGWYPTIKELKHNTSICLSKENLDFFSR
jgi:hypothetical protein